MCGGFFFWAEPARGRPEGPLRLAPGRIMSVAGAFMDSLLTIMGGGGGYNKKKVSMLRWNTAIL